jgi:hypothetical protein
MRLYTTEKNRREEKIKDGTMRKGEREREREREDTTIDQALHDEHTLVITNVVNQRFYVLFGNI